MKRIASFLLAASVLLGCRKDDIVVCTPVVTLAVLNAAAPPVQVFTFDLGQAQNIRTQGGATLAFSANTFTLPDGQVAAGSATLRVREIYTVPDMVLANAPTSTTYGWMLVSGGEFNIQAWQGNIRLRGRGLSRSLNLTSPIPAIGLDTTPMSLWAASSLASTVDSTNYTGWISTISPIGTSPTVTTTATPTGPLYSVGIPLDSISWWNIDQFWHAYAVNGVANIQVNVPDGATETRAYFRPVGYNGLARCEPTYNDPTRWTSQLPLAAEVIAVVLQVRNGQFYYGTQRVITRSGLIVTPTLEALSATEIVQRIRQL